MKAFSTQVKADMAALLLLSIIEEERLSNLDQAPSFPSPSIRCPFLVVSIVMILIKS